jgi:hypothetical protein
MIYKITDIILLILVFSIILFYYNLITRIIVSKLNLLFILYNIIFWKIKIEFKFNYVSKTITPPDYIIL